MSFLYPSLPNKAIRKTATIIATGFGLGYSPFASGTVGSILGCAIVWLFAMLAAPVWAQILVCVVLFLLGIPCASIAEKDLGGIKDNGKIVCDEYFTFPVCMLGLTPYWQACVWLMPVCFVVVRILDITKPFPAYRSQSLPAGLGIMVDDLIVSLYALGINWILFTSFFR
ncbi:MAG: phosphatidylglycerophosphatase A [Kiritimatiellia bacterium]